MVFCDQSWNFTNFASRIVPNLHFFFFTTKKFSSDLESLHFPTFSAKHRKCKIGKRDGHGKSINGHGKIFCQVCGNPEERFLMENPWFTQAFDWKQNYF